MSLSKFIPYIVAGGCAVVLIIICIIWYCYRRSRRLRYKEFSEALAARDQTLQYDEILSRSNPGLNSESYGQVAITMEGKSILSSNKVSATLNDLKSQKTQGSDQYTYKEFNPFESPDYDAYSWKSNKWDKGYDAVKAKLDRRLATPQRPTNDTYSSDLDVTGSNATTIRDSASITPHPPPDNTYPTGHIERPPKDPSRDNVGKHKPPRDTSVPSGIPKPVYPVSGVSHTLSPHRRDSLFSEAGMSSHGTVTSRTSATSTVRLGRHQLDYMNKQLESGSLYGPSSKRTSRYGSKSRYSSSRKQKNTQTAPIPSSRGLLREDGSYVSAVAENKTNLVKSQLMKKAQARGRPA